MKLLLKFLLVVGTLGGILVLLRAKKNYDSLKYDYFDDFDDDLEVKPMIPLNPTKKDDYVEEKIVIPFKPALLEDTKSNPKSNCGNPLCFCDGSCEKDL